MEFSRRRKIAVENLSVWVVSLEYLILSKLTWGKEAGSEFQLRDVSNLIANVEDLNWEYMNEWARNLGLAELLEEEDESGIST